MLNQRILFGVVLYLLVAAWSEALAADNYVMSILIVLMATSFVGSSISRLLVDSSEDSEKDFDGEYEPLLEPEELEKLELCMRDVPDMEDDQLGETRERFAEAIFRSRPE